MLTKALDKIWHTSASADMTTRRYAVQHGAARICLEIIINVILWTGFMLIKLQLKKIDCDEFIFKKILVGDKSDNIASVVTWQKEMKNGKLRNYAITDKTAETIWKQYIKEYKDFTIDFLFSSEAKDILSDIIYRVIGQTSVPLIKTNLTTNIAINVVT